MITAAELTNQCVNHTQVERGLMIIEKLILNNRTKGEVDVKLSKTYYNEYELKTLQEKLEEFGYWVFTSIDNFINNDDENTLNYLFTVKWRY